MNPQLFSDKPFWSSYMILLLVAYVGSVVLILVDRAARGQSPKYYVIYFMTLFPVAFYGARMTNIVVEGMLSDIDLDMLLLTGGLTVWGGLLFGFIYSLFYFNLNAGKMIRFSDIIVPYICVGYAVARIGCLLNGCCYGKVAANFPFAIKYPFYSSPYHDHLEKGLIQPTELWSLPVYPIPLFSVIAMIPLFFLLMWGRTRTVFSGENTMRFLFLFSAYRLFTDCFREYDASVLHNITNYQLISMLVIVLTLFVTIYVQRMCMPLRISVANAPQ